MVDYIVVGGGSAGCAVAGRLSEMPDAKIALFETGPRDLNPYIHLPVTYYKTAKGKLLNRFNVQQDQGAKLAPMVMVQGQVLGGGSSVNGMVYIRGCPEDYDGWEQLGCPGWGYKDVLPYFRKAEDNNRFSNGVHGTGGPLGVSDQLHTSRLTMSWLQACQEAGIPMNQDFNSGSQAGCGLYQVTIRNGRRCSAAVAYLSSARARPNLSIRTGQRVTRILVEGGRAVGVEYVEKGAVRQLRAEQEVILCAGAIGSPRMLMLSGIGPAEHLKEVGVPVVHDLPGVGQNLQDHMDIFLIYELTGPYSYDKYKKLRWQAWAALQYGLFRNGPIASNVCEGGAFWWGNKDDRLPDLQMHFLPGAGIEQGVDTVPGGNGCTLNICQTRPKSRGTVRLKDANPTTPPIVAPNYLSDPYDLDRLVEATKLGEDIMRQKALSKFLARTHLPEKKLQTRQDYDDFVRANAQGALHPSGACRMGTDDMAVVDVSLRVHGLPGLRVADTSIMPRLISGNTNAPAIMIGERVSDFIKGNKASVPA
jgi:choline dehydrogenase-like flavoprotein